LRPSAVCCASDTNVKVSRKARMEKVFFDIALLCCLDE
jgi:hypothetical protein